MRSTEKDCLLNKSASDGSFQNEKNERFLRSDELVQKNSTEFGFATRFLVVIVVLFIITYVTSNQSKNSSDKDTRMQFNKVEELSLYSSNEYGNTSSMFPYPFLDNSLLIEPYKNATIIVSNMMTGCFYAWNLSGSIGAEYIDTYKWSGESSNGYFSLQPKVTGLYELHVDEYCDGSSAPTRSIDKNVWVKYVRREIMSLTEQDRESFLDALYTLWTVQTVEGKELYGEDYKSIHYLSTLHQDAGANSVCDEFHNAPGFMNNHAFLTTYAEQSLQLIDPSTTMHYMDYTKYFESDAFFKHIYYPNDGGNWTVAMSDKFFGSNDPYTGQLINSRWANLELPRMDAQFFEDNDIPANSTFFPEEEVEWLEKTHAHLTSPYGLLRSPWNINPSTYLTRYNSIDRFGFFNVSLESQIGIYLGVDCDTITKFGKDIQDKSLSYFLQNLEGSSHGNIHFTYGGSGGEHAYDVDQILRNKYGFQNYDILSVSINSEFMKTYLSPVLTDKYYTCSNYTWIDGNLISDAEPGTEGGPYCSCPNEFFQSEDQIDILIEKYFAQPPLTDIVYTLSFEEKKEVMGLICGRMPYLGDIASSAAAFDPLFWVSHGAVERLFQYYIFQGNVFSDMNYETDNTCSGHKADSTKAWLKGLRLQDRSVLAETLTNADLASILHPMGDGYRDLLNYIYDESKYPWCGF